MGDLISRCCNSNTVNTAQNTNIDQRSFSNFTPRVSQVQQTSILPASLSSDNSEKTDKICTPKVVFKEGVQIFDYDCCKNDIKKLFLDQTNGDFSNMIALLNWIRPEGDGSHYDFGEFAPNCISPDDKIWFQRFLKCTVTTLSNKHIPKVFKKRIINDVIVPMQAKEGKVFTPGHSCFLPQEIYLALIDYSRLDTEGVNDLMTRIDTHFGKEDNNYSVTLSQGAPAATKDRQVLNALTAATTCITHKDLSEEGQKVIHNGLEQLLERLTELWINIDNQKNVKNNAGAESDREKLNALFEKWGGFCLAIASHISLPRNQKERESIEKEYLNYRTDVSFDTSVDNPVKIIIPHLSGVFFDDLRKNNYPTPIIAQIINLDGRITTHYTPIVLPPLTEG